MLCITEYNICFVRAVVADKVSNSDELENHFDEPQIEPIASTSRSGRSTRKVNYRNLSGGKFEYDIPYMYT